MHPLRRLTAALLLAGCAPLAAAWGPEGHRTVGAIADRLLRPPAHAAVLELLAGDLDKFGRPSGRTTLEAVSDWADEIRGTPADRPRWHYDNIPLCARVPRERYCPGGQCNTAELERLAALLRDPRTTARERNEALKWVVHLVADIHQPLHAADNHDRGGNDVQVVLAGVHTRGRQSLHRAWDNELVRLALHTRSGQPPPANIDALAAEAQQLLADAGEGSPDSWAFESNNLARNVAYTYPGFACNIVSPGIVVLDAAYQQQAEALVRERLLLAGARLAALLNRTLAPAPTAAARRPQ
jgi:nuclease S1